MVIVLGEDISRFRDASKDLYAFLRSFSWGGRVERLGFDEVWMDMTDVVAYNLGLLNRNNLKESFFCLSRDDPTRGFAFDATTLPGHAFPENGSSADELSRGDSADADLRLQLLLASHLAQWLRHQLEEQKGYTATVGIATSKLLSKLVGNLHKPKSQTTLMPPYGRGPADDRPGNVTAFMDAHEIGKIPGIGFKLATKIRAHVLQKQIEYEPTLVTGRTADTVSTHDVRIHPGMSAEVLEKLLAGPGSPHGIGLKVWQLVNGVDDSEVGKAREVPRQISVEDSYVRLNTVEEVMRELRMLAGSLLRRMRIDLLQDDDDTEDESPAAAPDDEPISKGLNAPSKHWLAHPRTLRLSTRPRPAPNPDGSRSRSFGRISRSGPLPTFVFSLTENVDALADRLVAEALAPMFRKLHPERAGWNLSLVNVAVTNMADAASDRVGGTVGRDIGKMFRRQGDVLREWRVEDRDVPPDAVLEHGLHEEVGDGRGDETEHEERDPIEEKAVDDRRGGRKEVEHGSEDALIPTQDSQYTATEGDWGDPEEVGESAEVAVCHVCGHRMPLFAVAAHARFHSAGGSP